MTRRRGRAPGPRAEGRSLAAPVPVAVVLLVSLVLVPGGSLGGRAPAWTAPSEGSAVPVLVGGDPVPAIPLAPAPVWSNVTPTGPDAAPPPAYGAASAYDPIAQETVLFGGCTVAQCPSNQTWIYDDGNWTNATPGHGSPPAREFASMDFDPNMGGLLLFGGLDVFGGMNDTWLFAGGTWTNLSYVGPGPSERYASAMAFDPQPEENGTVLYGGCFYAVFSLDCFNDTWIWEGWSGWTLVANASPPLPEGFAAMAYDPSSGALALTGGCDGTDCDTAGLGTWEFADSEWSEVGGGPGPGPVLGASAVSDPAGPAVLLVGGLEWGGGYTAATWSFSNGSWQNVTPATTPPGREFAALTLDATGTTPLLVGGENGTTTFGDTWAFEVRPGLTAAPGGPTAEAGAPVTWSIGVSGGTPPFALSVSFDDGSWGSAHLSNGSATLTHRYDRPGNYSAEFVVLDAVGESAYAEAATVEVTNGLAVSVHASPSAGDVGRPVTLSAVAANGTGPFAYAWQLGDGSNASGASVVHDYPRVGTFSVNLSATDAADSRATASLAIAIAPDPAVAPSASANLSAGTPGAFHAGLSGGTGPFAYRWTFGDGASSALPSPTHVYGTGGTFAVTLWVNDSAGGSAHAVINVTVAGPSSTSTSGGSSFPSWFWLGAGLLALAGVIGAIVLIRRGGRTG